MWHQFLRQLQQLPPGGWNALLAAAAVLSGFLFKGIATLIIHLYSKTNLNYSLFKSIVNRLNKPVSCFLPLLTLSLVLPLMELSKKEYNTINKITGILLIVTFSMVLVAVVKIFEDFLYHLYDLNKSDNLRERKIRTQIQFIRKLIISMIV